MKIIYGIPCIAFLLFVSRISMAQNAAALTVSEFEKGITNKDSIQLLDVRTAGEYNNGHLSNALLADWNNENEFTRRINFIDKQKPVYVYCLGGSRSAAAASKLRSMGYEAVYELKGGINAWKAANKDVAKKSGEPQMGIDELKNAIGNVGFVLVEFGAEWCPPCKKMEPVIKRLQENHPNKFVLVKVDGARDEEILKKYGVKDLPVFILFKDGKQVFRKDGTVEENEIASLLN